MVLDSGSLCILSVHCEREMSKLGYWDYKHELFSACNACVSQESIGSRWLSEAKHHTSTRHFKYPPQLHFNIPHFHLTEVAEGVDC